MSRIPRAEGCLGFGDNPVGYAAARPDYPDALYARLIHRCGLCEGTAVFEIGAGTGLGMGRLRALSVFTGPSRRSMRLNRRSASLFLRDLARIADEQFGGCVERPFITVLYTAQRV
jgi:hypothetical protein